MNSIRSKLLLGLILTILPLILASYVFLYYFFEASLRDEFDANLAKRLQAFAQMAEWDMADDDDDSEVYMDHGDDEEDFARFEFAELALPEYQVSANAEYYEVWDASGTVLARSPSLLQNDLPREYEAGETPGIIDVALPDGRRGRMAVAAFVANVDEGFDAPVDTNQALYLAVARSTEGILNTLAVLRISLLIAGTLVVIAAFILIWYITKRGLRPLDDIGRELQSIGDDDLSQRVETANRPAELVPVCTRLNEMLDRLNAVFERERRFTSDVAHELRTPIAELRTLAEVSTRRENLAEADRRSYQDTIEIAARMERLISTLLELSRCSSGQIVKELKRANLAQLVENSWKPFEGIAAAKHIDVRMGLDNETELRTDPLILGTILSNLFSNAVSYTPGGGEITLDCETEDGAVVLNLSNTTNDLNPADVPNLFEKFWRKHGPDSGTDNHLGLGLALVAALARVLGIRVEGQMPADGILRIRMLHPV